MELKATFYKKKHQNCHSKNTGVKKIEHKQFKIFFKFEKCKHLKDSKDTLKICDCIEWFLSGHQ